jgi:Ca-activated chloride channel family protein
MRPVTFALTGLLAVWTAQPGMAQQTQQDRPVFHAAVDRVTVAVTVRDKRGRPVTTLTADDFHLVDNGKPQPVLEVHRDTTPVAMAILADISGSMEVAHKRETVKEAARQLVGLLTAGEDRVGLYAFDTALDEVQPLEPAPSRLVDRLDRLAPWGRTKLFDAIAETGRKLAESGAARRAVVVLTDGDDNASQLSAGEVSAIASSIDVPVYVLVIVSPLDRVGQSTTSVIDTHLAEQRDGMLGNLARWTGGEILLPIGGEELGASTKQIVQELRQSYLLAFEAGREPGWHPLELKTKKTELVVRARSGYMVADRPVRF